MSGDRLHRRDLLKALAAIGGLAVSGKSRNLGRITLSILWMRYGEAGKRVRPLSSFF
jgi:hypothetical protein